MIPPRVRSPVPPILLALATLVSSASPAIGATDETPLFVEKTREAGLDFVHENGRTGKWYFPEIYGAGAALFDYDGDGDLDLYLVQGGPLAGETNPPRDRLYRNDLARPGAAPRFVDVTETSRIDARGYGMSAIAADFDGDGHVDLYVANLGSNQLWRNRGDGTFEDVTDAWHADDRRWSAALSVADFDRDGRLDLFVGNYVRWSPAANRDCRVEATGQSDYCHPSVYPADPDLLFHNVAPDAGSQAGGRFEDVSATALPDRGAFPALGAVAADLDDDGWIDLYVAHDETPNQLWRNLGGEAKPGAPNAPRFADEALLAGVAVNGRGQAEASMGVDAGDLDEDGDLDLFLTHFDGQTNTLYAQDSGFFRDETNRRGLGASSLPFTGFGTLFVDFDLDGHLDLFSMNGAVRVLEALAAEGDPLPFHQRDQIWKNDGSGRFVEISDRGGPGFTVSEVSRGAAVGDIDNDGDADLVVTRNGGPARLLLNTTIDRGAPADRAAWIGLRLLVETPSGGRRDALGAVATLQRADAPSLVRRVRVDGGYVSSHDSRIVFGLGASSANAKSTKLTVRWPDGRVESFPPPPVGEYTTILQTPQKDPDR